MRTRVWSWSDRRWSVACRTGGEGGEVVQSENRGSRGAVGVPEVVFGRPVEDAEAVGRLAHGVDQIDHELQSALRRDGPEHVLVAR